MGSLPHVQRLATLTVLYQLFPSHGGGAELCIPSCVDERVGSVIFMGSFLLSPKSEFSD